MMPIAVHDPPQSATVHDEQTTGGGWGDNLPPGAILTAQEDSPEPSRTGIWVGLAAITMTFAAFTSALVVTRGSTHEWNHIALPRILYLNSIVLLGSSLTLEIARRTMAAFARGRNVRRSVPMAWLYATLLLGLLFVIGQYAAWLRLKSAGLYLASNLSSSFFYVLTAVHGVHVLGGLLALSLVIRKFSAPLLILRKSTMDSTSYYWHFMGILWLYLLGILLLKL
jgi:cytochrome c oxidase subunit III